MPPTAQLLEHAITVVSPVTCHHHAPTKQCAITVKVQDTLLRSVPLILYAVRAVKLAILHQHVLLCMQEDVDLLEDASIAIKLVTNHRSAILRNYATIARSQGKLKICSFFEVICYADAVFINILF